MKFQRTVVILTIMLVLLYAQAMTQPAAVHDPSVMIISLHDFINGAIQANPEIFVELTKLKQADAQALQSKAVYDVVFNLHYNRIHDKPYNALSASRIQESDTDNFGAGVSWIAPYTGTRLKAGLDYNHINAKAQMLKTVDLYNPEIYFEVQQPLLRNWLGIVDSFPIKQAELNRLIMRETVDEGIEIIIADLYDLYFNWYLAHHQNEIFSKNAKNGEALVKTIDNKVRSGLADATDLAKTRIMSIGFVKSRDLAEARRKYLTRKIYVWMKGEKALPMTKDLAPEKNIDVPITAKNFTVHDTRQMRILDLSKRLLLKQMEKNKNELLPDLNFNFAYRAKSYSDDSARLFKEFDYNNYSVGLSLNYPLQDTLARGNYKETKYLLKKWENDVAVYERRLTQKIEELGETISTYESIMKLDTELKNQAALQLREEEKKYLQGRSDLYFTIQSRNEFLHHELVHITDLVDSKRLAVQLLGLIDRLKRD